MSFDPYSIIIGIAFGIVGYAAWRYGRKNQSARHMILAVMLMGYGYFVPNPWLCLAAGLALTFFLFWP